MKLYYKVKLGGKWNWLAASDTSQVYAKSQCECRVCNPDSILITGVTP